MKTVTLILVFSCCLGPLLMAQEGETSALGLRFYQQLAQRDAAYESSFPSMNLHDEQDYWTDQHNYERQLGKADFTAYLVYMKGKKDAYLAHLETCSDACDHSRQYLQRAGEYLTSSDSEYLVGKKDGTVVQNIPKRLEH